MTSKNPPRLVSSNEMLQAAKDTMLDGREPTSDMDWKLIVNFFAANIADGCEETATLLLAQIYNIPLQEWIVKEIVKFQIEAKQRKQRNPIDNARILVLRGALRLECQGMKRRGRSVYAIVKEEMGFKGSKASVLEQLDRWIEINILSDEKSLPGLARKQAN